MYYRDSLATQEDFKQKVKIIYSNYMQLEAVTADKKKKKKAKTLSLN